MMKALPLDVCVDLVVAPTMKPSNQKLSSKMDNGILNSENALTKRRKRHPEESNQYAVAMVVIYRYLGQLLPEHYDPDRRSLR